MAGSVHTGWARVALDVPLPGPFDYRAPDPVAVGTRVIVPFGKRVLIGVVVDLPSSPSIPVEQVREIERILDDLPPFTPDWMRLCEFAAGYYHRPLGEVMLPALPPPLRKVSAYMGKRAAGGPVVRVDQRGTRRPRSTALASQESNFGSTSTISQAECLPAATPLSKGVASAPLASSQTHLGSYTGLERIQPNPEQQTAIHAILEADAYAAFLLHGVTGSGKTEVYLHAIEAVLRRGRQALLMVPEINLTPQLLQVLLCRLQVIAGPEGVAVLHSGLSDGERLRAWLRAVRGEARVVLGTRLSILTPLPKLGLIVVDEEHDTSYKQQEGLRYSARDLAIWRARDLNIPVVLGSATPSLETWQGAQQGRYHLLALPTRAVGVALPEVRLIDTRRLQLKHGMAPQLIEAIQDRLQGGQQVLMFLNRRGYAPVLHCAACGWVSQCDRCSAYRVLHRSTHGALLRCHHCGAQERVKRACPDCGNHDLLPMGRGTQRVEEHMQELFPGARIARIDADSTRRKGSAEALLARVHAGEVDILVGTQMVAKGHDFRNLGLVGVLNADAMLFSHDFRAPERLFAQLMQVAGRAGRHVQGAEVLIQTGYPEQPVYQALLRHDYEGFAAHLLGERRSAGLPPFSYHALLTAEERELAIALGFLAEAKELGLALLQDLRFSHEAPAGYPPVILYDPVPLRVVRVKNIERAQLLIESFRRPLLQQFLREWLAQLPTLPSAHRVRWQLEVDPLEI